MSFIGGKRESHTVSPPRRRWRVNGQALAMLALAALLHGGFATAGSQSLTDGGAQISRDLSGDIEFLPVDQAFRLSAERGEDGSVTARWDIADEYYLYRHAFDFELPGDSPHALGDVEIPDGTRTHDEFFGDVEVYHGEAWARLGLEGGEAAGANGELLLAVSYQGCAEAGLCYAPETRWVRFDDGAREGVILARGPGSGETQAGSREGAATAPVPAAGQTPPPAQAPGSGLAAPGTPEAPISGFGSAFADEGRLAAFLDRAALPAALALFFLAGVGLALTPCVLPMVPILSSIIVGQGAQVTQLRAFTLSMAYVLGMAVTYAFIGTLMGLFGAALNIQAALQAPLVLVTFAGIFVLLALAMFGFYELRLPQRWQVRIDAASRSRAGGRHGSVAAMGALSSLVVSPCISAPLAGALMYISASGDAVIGGTVLLALALGMGAPLVVLGTTGGQLLPKAGPWMHAVKAVFGVGLLAVAVWLLERVVPGSVALALWAMLAIGSGVYLGALDFAPRQGWGQLWKATGSVAFIYGVLLLIGSASGADNPYRPLERIAAGAGEARGAAALDWQPVRGLAELEARIEQASAQGRPVMVDLYADWCISCKTIERNVYPAPEVRERLAQLELLRADVTDNNAETRALLQEYGLFGPPSFLFFGPDGRELEELRIQGEVGRQRFAQHLERVLGRMALAGTP